MGRDPKEPDGLDEAIAEAEGHAYAVESAYATATAPTRPVWTWPLFVAALAALVAVGVFNYRELVRPPETPPERVIESDLRMSTASVVREIEALRAGLGRPPTSEELLAQDLLVPDEDEYRVVGDGYVCPSTSTTSRASTRTSIFA